MRAMGLLAAVLVVSAAHAEFSFKDDNRSVTVLEDGKPVLVYHYDLVMPPEGIEERYRRTAYIHPLYGLDGEVMTQDFPPDHFHHRGVFWAWPLCTVGERPMDVWALDGVRQVTEKCLDGKAGETAELAMQNVWVYDDAPEEPKVRETIRFTVHPVEGDMRAIDFHLRFENVSGETVKFLGAENKGYGGFNFRPDATRKPMHFTAADGPVSEDKLRHETPWADVSYPLVGAKEGEEASGPMSGVAIFQHPSNPGYPHPGWIFRHYSFLGVSWPHEESHLLAPGEAFELRYRMLVHRGDAAAGGVKAGFEAYTEEAKRD